MRQNLKLGEKIRNYRKRAGLGQLGLEVTLGLAEGHISRLESGKVNPRRELLLQIAHQLKLDHRETADLLEVMPLFPAEAEIEAAIEEVEEYLEKPGRLAYLLDEWGHVYAVSEGFVRLLGFDDATLAGIKGKHLYEIILNPQYRVQAILDPEYSMQTFARELARNRQEVKLEGTTLLSNLMKLPYFPEIWEVSKGVTGEEILDPSNKIVHFVTNGNRIKYQYSREGLKENPRFEIFEYTNPTAYGLK